MTTTKGGGGACASGLSHPASARLAMIGIKNRIMQFGVLKSPNVLLPQENLKKNIPLAEEFPDKHTTCQS
jgi:hypothetical protein